MELKIYKRGQAVTTRLTAALAVFVIVAVGCYLLYGFLQARAGLWVQVLVPLGLAAATGLFLAWLSNRPTVADFMIAAEGEIKKVAWSSRKEIVASTTVVMIVVVFFAILLRLADMAFVTLFRQLLGIY